MNRKNVISGKTSSVSWVEAFEELTIQLANFYSENKERAGYILYRVCSKDTDFITNNNNWFKKLSRFENIEIENRVYLTPLQVFSSIADSTLSSYDKTKRINIYIRLLNFDRVDSTQEIRQFETINFNGSLHLDSKLLITGSTIDEQKSLWKLFDTIFSKSGIPKKLISETKSWNKNDLRELTIFLFLISPNYVLPLDKYITAFLEQKGKYIREPKGAKEYNKLLTEEATTAYRTVVLLAHNLIKESDLSDSEKEHYEKYIGDNDYSILSPHQCKIIAIKPHNRCNPEYLKSLKTDTLFKFYQGIDIDDDVIHYQANLDRNLFSLDSVNLNLSAIVGKNGTGKSTVIELLLLAFNNISYIKNKHVGSKAVDFVEKIHLEFWFETDALYKADLQGIEITFTKYKLESNNQYVIDEELNITELESDSFFYTISLNYSIHGLNSNYNADWLTKVFHKNDSYQTPVVIEPFRNEGNVNINSQEALAKHRLLTNLLQVETNNNESLSLRALKKGMIAELLSLKVSKYKYKNTNPHIHRFITETQTDILRNILFEKFKVVNHSLIDLNNNIDTPEYYCHYYIIKKLVHICKTYNSYTCFISSKPKSDAEFIPVSFSKIDEFIDTLRKDHSHTTYKLRQAINFLKYDIYPENTWDNINIESTSLLIHDIVSQSHNEKVEYFLPPSFLSVDIHSEKIYSEDRIEFSRLSSGEKQKIYVINSILYHLRNLDSVSESGNDKLNKYNYVNVFLDEIELCFHPELQRMFILELRDTLKKINLKYIYGLNFCFVTHSPFLLSDIPSTNILLLDNMDKNKKLGVTFPLKYDTNSKKTFAANIHDLLVDGFFMDGSIGAFAESTIKDIVKLHIDISNNYELGLNKSKYEQNFHRYEFIHAEIGDGFIKNVIGNHLSEIRKKLKKPRHEKIIDNEISTLEERISLLKKEKSHDKN